MRSVHPDHGGDQSVASTAVFELAEARKILTDTAPVVHVPTERPTSHAVEPPAAVPGRRRRPRPVDARRPRTGRAPAWTTVRADFPYRKAGRRAPDRPPMLMAAVRDELAAIGDDRVVVGGRSMGGRICSMVAAGADGEPPPATVAGVRARSRYPLHPPGKPRRPARRAPAGDHRAVPVRPRHQGPVRHARRAGSSGRRRSPARSPTTGSTAAATTSRARDAEVVGGGRRRGSPTLA